MYKKALFNTRKMLDAGEVEVEEKTPQIRSFVPPRQQHSPEEAKYDPMEFIRNGMQRIKEAASQAPEEFSRRRRTPQSFGKGVSRETHPDMVESTTEEGVKVTENAAHYGLVKRPASRSSTPTGSRKEFVSMLMPHAIKASEETGLDPRLIIAQAAQETGWGKSAPNNNYFGIKSHGKSGGSTQRTHEYVDGKKVYINDSFRGYESPADSVMGYVEFLKTNPRYSGMLKAPSLGDQVRELGKSGYATDPNYASSVLSIARSIEL